MKSRGISFRQKLNVAQVGPGANKPARGKKFTQETFRMGHAPDIRWDKSLAVADSIEDEELTRKLGLRK